MVSSVATDRGAIYLLQRGAHADPALVVNAAGQHYAVVGQRTLQGST